MDFRAQASLLAAMLSFALAASVLLRTGRRRVRWTFAGFGLSLAIWYATVFLDEWLPGEVWLRISRATSVLVPLSASWFFQAFLGDDAGRLRALNRTAWLGALALVGVMFSPIYDSAVASAALIAYLVFFLATPLGLLVRRARRLESRVEAGKLRFLALVGMLAALFALVDYLPLVGVEIPPLGTLLVLLFLYVLSQSILRYRLLDLYELAGRLSVLTLLALALAGVLGGLSWLLGGGFSFHVVVAAGVFLLLLQPLSARVEQKISQIFLRDRYDFARRIADLRQRVAHVLDLMTLYDVVLRGLERTRRVTHASIYLEAPDALGLECVGYVGQEPPARLEVAPSRPLIEALKRDEVLVIEQVRRALAEHREVGREREAESMHEVAAVMEALNTSVCCSIVSTDGEFYGLLCVRDDRLLDAYTADEVALMVRLARQIAVSVENSRLHETMKRRDRLAVLGQMSAGLAHEIRNPLGAIKASAQYLAEEQASSDPAANQEFLGIIVEEVDRLNRVVSSFLDYVNPRKREAEPTDVNAVIVRTLQLLNADCADANIRVSTSLQEDLPLAEIGSEPLRQVLINLAQNAIQAMDSGGALRVRTNLSRSRTRLPSRREWIEIRVIDTGPGIPQRVLNALFVPFVTTKDRGTGLGLAISQRIVDTAGGEIDVRTNSETGTTFIIRLPATQHEAESIESITQSWSEPAPPLGSDTPN